MSKEGVGAGWIAAANCHVQAHKAPVGGGGSMPHVPGVGALRVPCPPEWGGAQAQNLQLVALEPGSERWAAVAGLLRASLPGARLIRIEQVQSHLPLSTSGQTAPRTLPRRCRTCCCGRATASSGS